MRPAGQMGNLFLFAIFFVHGISVTLEISLEVPQHGQRCAAAPGRAIVKQYRSIQGSMVYPIPTGVGSALLITVQYFYSCFIDLQVAFGLGMVNKLFV